MDKDIERRNAEFEAQAAEELRDDEELYPVDERYKWYYHADADTLEETPVIPAEEPGFRRTIRAIDIIDSIVGVSDNDEENS